MVGEKLAEWRLSTGVKHFLMFTQPLPSIGWLLACDWLALDSLWVVPTSGYYKQILI
jgi:hypothetical protein